MHEADHVYFARRAREEQDAAGRAVSQNARNAHAELSRRYAALAAALEAASGDDDHCLGDRAFSRASVRAGTDEPAVASEIRCESQGV